MQITFDPLNEDEANFVARIVSRAAVAKPALDYPVINISNHTHSETIRPEDAPDVGADAPSAAPLPLTGTQAPSAFPASPGNAPSTAAATLFPTAPAAPQASVPPAPPVPSPPVPAAPPPAPAPMANAAPATPAGDVDSTGLPWDERIHASTKTMNADGTWRQRRGLNDPGLVKRVEAELRVMQAVITHPTNPLPGQDATLDAAVATAVAGNVPPAPIAATVVVPPPPVTPVTPVAVPAPPVPAGASSVVPIAPRASEQALIPASEPIDFGGLMALLTGLVSSGKVTESQVHEILRSVELDPHQIGVLAGDPAKTQQVADALRALVGA